MPSIPKHAKKVFEGIIHDVYHYEQKLYDGSTATFEMLKRNDSVQCVATVEDKILLIKDSQPNRDTLWALPGGQSDTNEDLLDAIAREFLEETGYVCDAFELYKSYDIGSKLDWNVHTYIARGASKQSVHTNEPGEKTEVHLVSFDTFVDIVCSPNFRESEFAIDILRMYKDGTLDEFKHRLFPNQKSA